MKKIRFSRELVYILGNVIMAFSVSLSAKADLGLSMIVSPAYILSQKVSFLTFGQAEYVVQFLLVVLICIILRKVRLSFAFSFVTALIYGGLLDLFNFMIRGIDASAMWVRVLLFVIGTVMTALSVSLMFHTYLSPCAYDFFVSKITSEKNLDQKKFKLCFDASFLIIAVVMSLLLFKRFVGVNFGTLIIALVNGHIIAFFSKEIEKRFDLYDSFPKLAGYFNK